MGWVSGIVVYFLVWWVTLFAVLPLWVTPAEPGDPGHHEVGVLGADHDLFDVAEKVRPEPGDEPLRPGWLGARLGHGLYQPAIRQVPES